ncbi:unnamed protein product [Lactuca saligna]|uniref:Uncharacterized protein n=1 Tax=Lactuca saligna TaxID=75948 RepID=A0AA35YFC6_LACSI|nr:unnamed protein product [Lactuca saligna]
MASANAISTASFICSPKQRNGNGRVTQFQTAQKMRQSHHRRGLVVRAAGGKDIILDDGARRAIGAGLNTLANAVGNTLGPKGRDIVIGEGVKDGFSIGGSIELPDAFENAGADFIREVASKTKESAGDGTATASVITREIIQLGLASVTSGANADSVKKGIDKTVAALVQELQKKATPVKGHDDIKAIASISAGNDVIGSTIADAMDKVGLDGDLSIQPSSSFETTIDVEEGMLIESGFLSPYFVTNSEELTVEFQNARVLVIDQHLDSIKDNDIIPLITKATGLNAPLLIIAQDVTGEALSTLVVNKIRGILNVAAIKAPGVGETRKALLQDIAIMTGATYLSSDSGFVLKNISVEQLGKAQKVTITKDSTTIEADPAFKSEIEARVSQIKKELSETDSVQDSEELAKRIANLSRKVAIIKLSVESETELASYEDAKNATIAAIKEGIVPGGGAAFVHLSTLVPGIKEKLDNADEREGADIIRKAIVAPASLIAQNAGVDGEVAVEKVKEGEWEIGYNAVTDKYENLVEAGVIDPAKVVRSALENSALVAGRVLIEQGNLVENIKAMGDVAVV